MALNTATGQFSTGTGAVGTNVAVSTLTFQPKIVLFWWSGTLSTTDAVGAGTHRFGFGAAISDTERMSIATISIDAVGSSDTGKAWVFDTCVLVLSNTTTIEGRLDFVSMDAGGFTLIVDDQFANSYTISYLAIGGDDLTNYKILTSPFDAPAGIGNETKTGVGFQPDALILIGGCADLVAGAAQAGSQISIGWGTSSTAQGVMNFGSRDGRPTMETFGYANNDEILAATTIPTMVCYARASLVSFNGDGFVLNWLETTGLATDYIYIALKGGQYLVGDFLTQTDTTTTVTETVGFQPKAVLFGSVCAAEDAADTPHAHDRRSLGAATDLSNRIVQGISDEDNLADSETAFGIETDNIYLNIVDDAVSGAMDYTAISSIGFSVKMTDADLAQYFVTYLAIGATTASLVPLKSLDYAMPSLVR